MIYDYQPDVVTIEIDGESYEFPIRDAPREEVLNWYHHYQDVFEKWDDGDVGMDDVNAADIEVVITTVKHFTYVPDDGVEMLTPTQLFDAFEQTVDVIVDFD